jgi:hypothetical protein
MKRLSVTELYEKHGTSDCLGGYTTLAYLRRCEGYDAAKYHGDANAADRIIKKCVSADKLRLIQAKYPGAFLLPVLKKDNALPLSLCVNIGLPVCLSVVCQSARERKYMPAIQRILYKPVFRGEIVPGRPYILVDDVITQGGTMAALMQFVSQNGGRVPAILSLTYAKGSRRIAPAKESLITLTHRFGNRLVDFLDDCGMGRDAVSQLTHSEIRYLMKFSSVENMKKKLYAL